MTNQHADSEGVQALDWNIREKRADGWGVANRDAGDCKVTINTGTLGSGNGAVTVNSGTALIDGTPTSISSTSVDIATGDSSPRKDVVYLDSTGTPVVSPGTPESIVPSGDSLAAAERPAPNDLKGTSATILAVVLVPADATSITSSELVDVRARADKEFAATAHESIGGGVASAPITNFEGDGLSVDPSGNLDATSSSSGSTGGYGVVTTVQAADSPYKASDGEIILVDASGGAVTVTLPDKAVGVMCVVKKVDTSTNTVTITPPGTESIDGGTDDVTISSQNVSREFVVGDAYQDYWIV